MMFVLLCQDLFLLTNAHYVLAVEIVSATLSLPRQLNKRYDFKYLIWDLTWHFVISLWENTIEEFSFHIS